EKSQHRHRIEVFIDQQLKIQTHFATGRTDAQRGDGGDLLAVAAHVSEHWGCPHRLHVRRTTGSRSSPLSSRKTSHPFRRQAFFNPRPLLLDPALDAFLIPLQRRGGSGAAGSSPASAAGGRYDRRDNESPTGVR